MKRRRFFAAVAALFAPAVSTAEPKLLGVVTSPTVRYRLGTVIWASQKPAIASTVGLQSFAHDYSVGGFLDPNSRRLGRVRP